ncbi:MAG: VOC family protein [Amaricoccus sp.]|uniref:VOC family protein n=1 Tax=Amaricoccus sp. TaxID=1872485 RepID=UPI0039E3D512
MFPKSISLVTLGVSDLARSRAFYAALGWEAHTAQEGVVFIQLSGQVLALFGVDDLADDMGAPRGSLGHGAVTLARNFGSEAEVDAAFELALSAGASVLKRPEKVFWGGYSGYFADPDGHVWELAMNPFWPLGEDGTLFLPEAQKP